MATSKKESLRKVEKDATPEITQEERAQRIQAIINEAQFRFKCCEIAAKFTENHEEMFTLADDVYNYSFHVEKDAKK